MKSSLLLIGLIGLLATVCVHASTPEEDEDVIVLTNDNFDEWIQDKPLVLVEFYAPWCGHCKSLAPEWAKAAGELKKIDPPMAYLAKVDATVEETLAARFKVEGYPTIFMFKNGVQEEYNGPREADGILEFLENEGPPTYSQLKSLEDAKAFVAANKVAVLGVLRPPMIKSQIFLAIKNLSRKLNDEDTAFAVEEGAHFDSVTRKYVASEIGKHYGVEMGAVVFLENGKKVVPCNILAKKYTAKKLAKCIQEAGKNGGEL